MTLSGEQVLDIVLVDGVVHIKEKVEVLDCFREEEALLPVLQCELQDIMDGGVATAGSGVIVETVEDIPAYVEIEGVLGGSVEEVGTLH